MGRVVPVWHCPAAKPGLSAEDEVEVSFLAQATPGNLGQVIVVAGKTRSEPFDLPVNNLSPEQQTVGGREFVLWSLERQRAIANIRVPEGVDSCIVLLLVTSTGQYQPVVLRRDDPAFRGGDIYFLNNSNKPVFGYVGAPIRWFSCARPAGCRQKSG